MSKTMYSSSVIAFVMVACSSSPKAPIPDEPVKAEPLAIQSSSGTSPATDAGNKSGIAFTQGMGKSKFIVGLGISQVDFPAGYRIVGSEGVFSVFRSGYTLGIPNATAKVRAHGGPPPGGSPGHNQLVRDYYVGAGLPESQIRTVDAYPLMMAIQPQGLDAAQPAVGKLQYYDSVISRQIASIPVAESFATARINEDSAVVSESAYWPEIPESVIAEAQALAATLADDKLAGAYLASLPTSDSKAGTVVIHHTSGVSTKSFAASAVFYVPQTKVEMAGPLHFDSKGSQVTISE